MLMCVEQGAAPLDAVDFIVLGEQQFGQAGSVLPGDSGDQSPLLHFLPLASKDTSFPEVAKYPSNTNHLTSNFLRRAEFKMVRA